MNIRWLETFVKAAKTENFRWASEELFLTQPAVTKQIKRLEQELDIQLFKRSGKAVKLTPEGTAFLKRAEKMTSCFHENMADFNEWRQGYTRTLSIACAPQIASSFLPELLNRFVSQFPHIDVYIDVAKSYDIGEKVSAGTADLGLARMPSAYINTTSLKVNEEPVVLLGPLLEDADESFFLAHYRILTHNHPDYWEELLKALKHKNPHIKTMIVSQVEVTKRFIEAGLGVSYLPLSMVVEEAAAKKLRIYPSEIANSVTSTTYLIEKGSTDEARAFKQFLFDQL